MPFHVSRETLQDLLLYENLLLKWNQRINLISRSEQHQVYERHFEDSLQIVEHIPSGAHKICDLGSGAGFPGLVLAIALKNLSQAHVTLVESNAKKCAFLREVARKTGTSVSVRNQRIEKLPSSRLQADVITSRALAPLIKLLNLAYPLMGKHSICVFHKGQYVDDELTEASKYWNMAIEKHPSQTDLSGVVLVLKNLDPKRQ